MRKKKKFFFFFIKKIIKKYKIEYDGCQYYPDIFDRPIPGQSLTDEPKNYPWEHPAQFSDLREARDRIFEGLTQEESVQQLYTMLRPNVPVEAIVRTVLFAGFHLEYFYQ